MGSSDAVTDSLQDAHRWGYTNSKMSETGENKIWQILNLYELGFN